MIFKNAAPYFDAFTAQRTTNQTTGTTLIFPTVLNQRLSNYNPATGIYTAKIAGWYHFDVVAYITNPGAAGSVDVFMNQNSFGIVAEEIYTVSAGGTACAAFGIDVKMSAGDQIYAGSNLMALNGMIMANISAFSGHYIGPV
jgi:hypothetical protein